MDQPDPVSVNALLARVEGIFIKAGLRAENARDVARVIVAGERDNCKSHGIYRIEGCLRVLAAGKVSPDAVPQLVDQGKSVIEVDAGGGSRGIGDHRRRPWQHRLKFVVVGHHPSA